MRSWCAVVSLLKLPGENYTPNEESHGRKPSTGGDQRGVIPELSTIINVKVATEAQREPWKRWKREPSALLPAVTVHMTEALLVCAVAQTRCWKEESSNNGGSFTVVVTWRSSTNTCARRAASMDTARALRAPNEWQYTTVREFLVRGSQSNLVQQVKH